MSVRRWSGCNSGQQAKEKKTQVIVISKELCYNLSKPIFGRENRMKHIKTLNGATLKQSAAKGGCGECQTSCQSACKTSCTVANQKCENNQ